MRRAICVVLCMFAAHQPFAATFEQQLMKLDFEERADQVCVKLGVDTIRKGGKLPGADRLMTSVSGRAVVRGNVVSAAHAAVRINVNAKSHWYRLKFDCEVSDDHVKALSFKYELGPEIPAEEWPDLGLWQH
jgi:hypothetical protein